MAYAPDGRLLATASGDGVLRVWVRKCPPPCAQHPPHPFKLSGVRVQLGEGEVQVHLPDAATPTTVNTRTEV